MQLVPNTWYGFGELFDGPPDLLKDGTRLWRGRARLFGSEVSALSLHVAAAGSDGSAGFREHLQVTVANVDRGRVDGLEDGFSPAQLLRDSMVCIAGAGYACDLLARAGNLTFSARGVVCATLNLAADFDLTRQTLGRRDEVQTAWRRGLLDDPGRSRADFKLGIRPMLRKVQALRDSGHVPDAEWSIDVLFGNWRANGAPVASPLAAGQALPDAIELQFAERLRRRGFRITDLFGEQLTTDS